MKGNMASKVETSLFKSESTDFDITSMNNKPVYKPVLKFDIKFLRECPIHRVGKSNSNDGLPDVSKSKGGNFLSKNTLMI